MATEALFNESYVKLLERTRIESADDEQTVALIQMSVSDVRTGFRKKLGGDRVSEIAAMPFVDNPTTDDEYTRAEAASIEVLWLTWYLIPRLPSYFMDNGNSVNNAFNMEPLTRDSAPEMMQKQLDILWSQIEDGLGDLIEDPEDFTSSAVRASSVGPDESYIIGSNFPGTSNGWCR